ncbi:MAG: transposase, partial [Terriglobales bacterium]
MFVLLHQLGPAENVAVAIESPASPITEPLVEAGWAVFSINPKQLDRCRDRFSPAGAKDDRRDAYVLAHCLRSDAVCFRRLLPAQPWQLDLRSLTRQRIAVQADLRVQTNRLREILLASFPQLLACTPGADEPWLWDLLGIAPTPSQAARLSRTRLAGLLRRHRIRRLSAEQLQTTLRSGSLPLPPASFERHGFEITCLLGILNALGQTLRQIERALAATLQRRTESENQGGQPRDINIILSLPGVGPYVAATLLAEAHQALLRRDYHALRAHAGVAPVTRSSGKSCLHAMRRSCNRHLRDALYHWSRCSCQHDERSRTRYQQLRARGHS